MYNKNHFDFSNILAIDLLLVLSGVIIALSFKTFAAIRN